MSEIQQKKQSISAIKVLHVISTRGLYGGERVLVNLIGHLNPDSIATKTAILFDKQKPANDVVQAIEEQGSSCVIIPCGKRFDLNAVRQLAKTIKDLDIDIIHCHEIKGRLYGLLTAKYLHVPLITSHHNWIRNKLSTTIFEYLDAVYLRFFDKIIPVSSSVFRMLRKYIIPAKKMKIIINGIDFKKPDINNSKQTELRSSLHIKDKNHIIGVVGRLSPEKGQSYFLKAAQIILKSIDNVSFVIVGDGHMRRELEEYAHSLHINEHVIFTGFRYDVVDFYSLLDVCIMPSTIEGTPMALLEAMSHGIPAIASDVGGIPDIIHHMKNGILVPPQSPEAIAKAVQLLLGDFKLYDHLSKTAQQMVQDQFSARRMASQYEEEYQRLMQT